MNYLLYGHTEWGEGPPEPPPTTTTGYYVFEIKVKCPACHEPHKIEEPNLADSFHVKDLIAIEEKEPVEVHYEEQCKYCDHKFDVTMLEHDESLPFK